MSRPLIVNMISFVDISNFFKCQPQTPTLMRRNPGESLWLTCVRVTHLGLWNQLHMIHTDKYKHTTLFPVN